jgi:hypothetical protein
MERYRPDGVLPDGEAPALRFLRRPATGLLARHVTSLWAVAAARGGHVRTLPDGCIDLTVDLRDGRPRARSWRR